MSFSQRIVARLGDWRSLALLGLLGLASGAASAQTLNYPLINAQNVSGTYTDLGTTGTVISTGSTDDDNSSAQNIGFTFNFDGQSFTQFVLNTNGLIRLGSSGPSTPAAFADPADPSTGGPFNSADPNDTELLAPFNFDLESGTSPAEYRVATTGTAPNRVCTIQWKNVSDKAGAAPKQYSNFSFQVQLFEGSNAVAFVYGTATASTNTDGARFSTVGIKGSGTFAGQLITTVKPSVNQWSTAIFQGYPYPPSTNGLNFRRTVLPDAGRTLRFVPRKNTDASVLYIYSAAKIPTPEVQVVQARIVNTGTQPIAIPVTLNVTGANSFSNSQPVALNPNDSTTVTFLPFTSRNAGTNNITVTLTPDENPFNDSRTFTQAVTASPAQYAITTSTSPSSAVGFPATTAAAAFCVRYVTSAPRTVNSISAYILHDATNAPAIGKTVYTAVLSSTGTLIARTPNYVLTSADVNTYKTFTFATPAAVPAGDFLVGLVQTNLTGGSTAYFPMGYVSEIPTRQNTFYTIAPFSATGGTPSDASPRNFGIYMLQAEVSTVTGVSKALETAVSVFPNPSNGEFTLDVRRANAKEALQVEVTNMLGQRVYSGSARDNFNNSLNLSHLANGLYTLKVSNGSEYMMRNIVVQK